MLCNETKLNVYNKRKHNYLLVSIFFSQVSSMVHMKFLFYNHLLENELNIYDMSLGSIFLPFYIFQSTCFEKAEF